MNLIWVVIYTYIFDFICFFLLHFILHSFLPIKCEFYSFFVFRPLNGIAQIVSIILCLICFIVFFSFLHVFHSILISFFLLLLFLLENQAAHWSFNIFFNSHAVCLSTAACNFSLIKFNWKTYEKKNLFHCFQRSVVDLRFQGFSLLWLFFFCIVFITCFHMSLFFHYASRSLLC